MNERHACGHCDKVFAWGEDADSDLVKDKSCRANAYWKLTAHMATAHPEQLIACPRSGETPLRGTPTYWRADGTCSFCGSISPERLFEAIEAGHQLGPTDKSYKVYVDLPNPDAGKPGIFSSANHQPDGDGWFLLTAEKVEELGLGSYERENYVGRWVKLSPTPDKSHAKFYFQHLDADQQQRFIDLLNAKKMNIGYPGHFYRLPFFCTPAAA